MIKFLKDLLGINQYRICYSYRVHGAQESFQIEGVSDFTMSYGVGKFVVKSMNMKHGIDSHWLEPVKD